MNKPVKFTERVGSLEALENGIRDLGVNEPEKAYLLGVTLAKLADKVKKDFNPGFRKYFDLYKELPGGFDCSVSIRRTFNFEENEEWRKAKAVLDGIETRLSSATLAYEQDHCHQVDASTGEILPTVSSKFTEVYTVKKR